MIDNNLNIIFQFNQRQPMSSDTEKEKFEGQEKKKTRRTRKDGEGRDFACPCGKSYLSYPALYTHIKTKHGGKAPSSLTNRPKFQMNDENAQKNPFIAICQELGKYLQNISKDQDREFFPDFELEDENYLKTIVKDWEENKDSQQNDGYTMRTCVDLIFGRFLTEIKDKTSPEGIYYLENMILNLKKGLARIKNSNSYCRQNSGSDLPNCFNSIILEEYLAPLKKGEKPITHKVLTLKILFFFASWLYQENYTNFTVKFNAV